MDLTIGDFMNNNSTKKSVLLVIVFIIYASVNLNAQIQIDPDFLWINGYGSADYETSEDVAIDNQGNIIITGTFSDDLIFGPTILIPQGYSDTYIAKFDPDGNPIWAISAGGSESSSGISVTTDNNNNIIVTGYFYTDITFGTTTLTSFGSTDVFVAKFNASGVLLWATQGGGESFDNVNAVTTDGLNNVYVAGSFQSYIEFGNLNFEGGIYTNIYLVKFNANGIPIWLRAGTGNDFYNEVQGLATNNANDVFITGSFGTEADFSGTILTSIAGPDIFLARYDTNGNLIWIKQAGGTAFNEIGFDIAIDSNNDIFITGRFSETVNFDNIVLTSEAFANIFIAKYDLLGNPQWAVQAGDSGYSFGKGISLDPSGNIAIIGNKGRFFDSPQGEGDDIYVGKFRKDGTKIWDFIAGGNNYNEAGGIVTDNNGELIVTGLFAGLANFGSFILNSDFSSDIFLGRLPSPDLNINPQLVDFQTVIIDSSSIQTVALSNPSTTALHIFDISLTGPDAASFSLNANFNEIAPLQSENVSITFLPLTPGIKTAYLVIESDVLTSPDTIIVTGTGGISSLSFSTKTTDFGVVDVNTISERNFTITNTGTQTVFFNDIYVPEPGDQEFGVLVLQDSIPPSGILNVSVFFFPTAAGQKSAILIFESNASSSPDTVLLAGTAVSAIIVEQPDSLILGQENTLNVLPPVGLQVTGSQFYYRRTGERLFQQAEMTLVGNVYVATIPQQYSTIRGIQYYVEFSDGSTVVTFPTIDPINSPASLKVYVDELIFPSQFTPAEYSIISIPLSIDNPDVMSVLGDDYGSYNNSVWRIFRWDALNESYLEHPDLNAGFSPGNSFWLIHRNGLPFKITNAASVAVFNNYNIEVRPGWNQIANPFAFPVDWLEIENSEIVDAPVRWDPALLDYEYNQSVLEPWEGYWVYNPDLQVVTLSIPPVESMIGSPLPKPSYVLDENEFIIQIKAKIENTKHIDYQNYAGMLSDNKYTGIKRNILEAPPIKNEIRLSIIDGDNKFAQKLVSANKDGMTWDLSLAVKELWQNVHIAFYSEHRIPEGFDIWLLNIDSQVSIPVENNKAVINNEDKGTINLKLIIGTHEFAKQAAGNISLSPTEYILYQNYPNPFNPSTTISYNLKEKSVVTLEIFDVLGSKIKTIANNETQNAGRHTVIWNGDNTEAKPVSSGVYLYRLKANSFVETKKMILVH
ncbi:MAG TPA: choice-of-anchor D domain-containing protein [Ignavibacteriaceae bacterium]|nr:choice-of-anchor D domain-containing protein [Ignavibacteriaceae bacterium]